MRKKKVFCILLIINDESIFSIIYYHLKKIYLICNPTPVIPKHWVMTTSWVTGHFIYIYILILIGLNIFASSILLVPHPWFTHISLTLMCDTINKALPHVTLKLELVFYLSIFIPKLICLFEFNYAFGLAGTHQSKQ